MHKTSFGFCIWCEGCGHGHGVWVDTPNEITGAKWTWNGSMDKPTFHPSLLIRRDKFVCHTFVRDGMIQYLPDCTHSLVGQTVPLQEL